MNLLLYYLFFAPGYGCVIVRDIYTILLALYKLHIIKFKILSKVSSYMFVPLLISLFGEYIALIYFQLFNNDWKKYKKIYDNYEDSIDNYEGNIKYIRYITYLYKLVIFYLVIKWIKPKFNFTNVYIPTVLVFIYLSIFPIDKSHFGKKVNIKKNYLYVFLLTSIIILFYLLEKFYSKLNILFFILLYLLYLFVKNKM